MMNNLEDNDTLTQRIIGCAIEVHRTLGPGLLESAYEQCMAHEMTLQDIAFRLQVPTSEGLFTLNACPRDSGKARPQGAKRRRGGAHDEHLQRGGRAFPEITRRAGRWQTAGRRCGLVVWEGTRPRPRLALRSA